jgi:dihydrofolate synthase / folylpolyglutamate synthase
MAGFMASPVRECGAGSVPPIGAPTGGGGTHRYNPAVPASCAGRATCARRRVFGRGIAPSYRFPMGCSMQRSLEQWLAWQQQVHPAQIALGLERVAAVAARLGLARPARSVVTIAGTNGKGSTAAFVEAIARAAGHRVGVYGSPHLLRYNERVRIDGHDADDAALVAAFECIEAVRGDTALTFFEYGTLAALWLFERAGLDLAVLEVGLGGRLDAVNLVDADVAVVTSVALDHTEWLGPDRETIGVEKAGIFRAGRPAVIGERDAPASVLQAALAIGATPRQAGVSYEFAPLPGGGFRYREGGFALDLPAPALAAPCQPANAAAAICALRQLDARLPVDAAAIAAGVAGARLPGRLQRIAGAVEIVLDVAHNPQAAAQLALWLRRSPCHGSTQAVFSALADKDIPQLVGALMGSVDAWRLAGLPEVERRGLAIEALWPRVASLLSRSLSSRHASVAEALATARASAVAGDRIVVYGSFHTVEAALRELEARPSPALVETAQDLNGAPV